MGHLAFAAAIEAIISNLMFRTPIIDDPAPEETSSQPAQLPRWHALADGVAVFLRLPDSLRPCRDKC